MDIVFEIVSRQKLSATFRTVHAFGEAGGYIGRSDECEWVLPDRTRQISRKHALVTFADGDFYIEDISSNGTFSSLGHVPLGKNNRHKITHGDGFIIGDYTIMARLQTDPRGYAPSRGVSGAEILSFTQPLSLNPLTAMDQEEEMMARERLGEYDDLFGLRKSSTETLSDNTSPYISTLQPVVPVPEQPEAPAPKPVPQREEFIPEDWNKTSAETAKAVGGDTPAEPALASREADMFFRALGFAEPPSSTGERTRILHLSAQLLKAAVSGMTHALRNRHECKNELRLPSTTTGFNISNNPLKFSPTEEAALASLLGPSQKGVMSPVESVRECFDNLHSHHMGLLAGARAVVRASLERVSPQAVEARLDADGPVRMGRTNKLWHTFIRMHQAIKDDEEGLASLFLQDFARAYELQGRTLNPFAQTSTGDKS